jgi:proline racemase
MRHPVTTLVEQSDRTPHGIALAAKQAKLAAKGKPPLGPAEVALMHIMLSRGMRRWSELAAASGIDRMTIVDTIRGKHAATHGTICALAVGLRCDLHLVQHAYAQVVPLADGAAPSDESSEP